jgi:hypothetical protein
MLSLTVEDIVLLVALWLVCGAVSAAVFIRWAVMKWGGEAVMNSLMNPKPKTKAAVGALMGLILSTMVPTGKTLTDENGKERLEEVPLLIFVGRQLFRQLEMQAKARVGGNKSGLDKAVAADGDLGGIFGSITMGKRKGETTPEWLLRVALESPQGQNMIGSTIEGVIKKMQGGNL